MKLWHDEDGEEFKNSDVCFGREYNPESGKIDVAKISICGTYPENGWSYNEEADEMAIIVRGNGWLETREEKVELTAGDVVYLAATERFRWNGDMDMIVPCGPAFTPGKHHVEEE